MITNANYTNNYKSTLWFNLILVYLVLDYGRFHDTLGLGFIRPLMMLNLLFIGMIIKSSQLFSLKNAQVKLIWLFILLLVLYIPFARNNYFAYEAAKTMFLYMPFVISIIVCVTSLGRLKKLFFISAVIMAYISLYAITHNGYGPGNYFLDENDLSLYINMWIPFCYFLFFAEKNKIRKIIYATSLILGLMAVVVTFSRGGFVGLIVVFFVIWLVSHRKIISLFAMVVLAFLVFYFSDSTYRAEMMTVTDTSESTAIARIESWKSAWNMFMDNPLGVGGNNFLVLFPEYQTDHFKRGMWGRAAHSLWFTLIPELGIGGIIIYFLLLYYNIRDILLLKRMNLQKDENRGGVYLSHIACAFLASLAGFFASATFLSVLYYAHYWYITGFIIAAVNIAKQLSKNHETECSLLDIASGKG